MVDAGSYKPNNTKEGKLKDKDRSRYEKFLITRNQIVKAP